MPSITAIVAGTIRAVTACRAVIIAGLAGITTGKDLASSVATIRIATITTSQRGTEATMAAATMADEYMTRTTTVSSDTTNHAIDPMPARIRTQPRAITAATLARTADTEADAAEVCLKLPDHRILDCDATASYLRLRP